jgi:hypothetical protein
VNKGLAFVLAALAAVSPLLAGQAASGSDRPRRAFTLTFTERIREETSDNVTSLNDSLPESSAYVRFRTSLMGRWQPSASFELTVRLTNENRYYIAPKSDPKLKTNYGLNEVFFDYLYLKWKDPFGLPLTLTLGRQDLMLGEGFIIWDGGPLDGSRSAYFNAVRADWRLGAKTALLGFYMRQPVTDTFLPLIHAVGQKLVEQEEEGYGLYLTGTAGRTGIEAYLFRKCVRASDAGPESGITNLGGRLSLPLSEALSLTAEGAGQSGKRGEIERRGRGGYFHLDYKTGAAFPLPAQLTLGGIALSGDDQATVGRDEGWDPAFSRWPKWSESLIYLFARESKPAYWTNFRSLYGSLNFAFASNVKLILTWHKLAAPQAAAPTAFLSGTGTRRGDLGIARLTYDISSNLQGHFLWEQFRPGDYYFSGAQSYAWVRFELLFRY